MLCSLYGILLSYRSTSLFLVELSVITLPHVKHFLFFFFFFSPGEEGCSKNADVFPSVLFRLFPMFWIVVLSQDTPTAQLLGILL